MVCTLALAWTWASVSSTGGLEDFPDRETVKNEHAGHLAGTVLAPDLCPESRDLLVEHSV
jgi:hypothetical protein